MTGPYEYVAPSYWLLDTARGGAHGFEHRNQPRTGAAAHRDRCAPCCPPEHLWPIDSWWNFHAGGGAFKDLHSNTFCCRATGSVASLQVWVEAENPGEKLKPGASVHAVIVTEMFKAATVVPIAAILPGEEKGAAVLTVSADSTAHKKQVELGVREGDKVQILSGVRPGEEVVVVGGLGVDDKAKVKIINTTVEESDEDDTPEPPEPAKK